jgi:hypothetical protein
MVQIQKRPVFVIACPAAVVKVEGFFTFNVILSIMPDIEPELKHRLRKINTDVVIQLGKMAVTL